MTVTKTNTTERPGRRNRFPLSRHRSESEKDLAADSTQQSHQTPNILCIDDDPEVSQALKLQLSEYDVDLTVAYFGTQGFWETITNKPDLVLMDVLMPNGDGKFVLESIRNNKELESVPVVVLTGLRDRQLKNEMLALGADRFLKKPIAFESLLCELNRFINIRRRPEQ